jgi:eukaryotic translation initiation factor 2C
LTHSIEYGIILKHPLVPLVDISAANASKDRPILVPPEVCTILPNQPFRGKLSEDHTAEMIKIACQPPNVNAQSITGQGLGSLGLAGGNSSLEHMGIRVRSQMATVPGRILTAPKVHYNNRTPAEVSNASWNLRNVRFAVGARLDNWGVLFTQDGAGENMTAANGRHVVTGFADMCSKSGMVVNKQVAPQMRDVQLPSIREDSSPLRPRAIEAIKRALMSMSPKPKIVLVVLSNTNKAIYNGIKHLCDIQLNVLTVCVQGSKFGENKVSPVFHPTLFAILNTCTLQPQYHANVALKVNAKLGGTNHVIDPQDKALAWATSQPTMMIGSDVTHPSPGSARGTPSIAAVVGSIDKTFSQFPCSMRLQQSKKEVRFNDKLYHTQ